MKQNKARMIACSATLLLCLTGCQGGWEKLTGKSDAEKKRGGGVVVEHEGGDAAMTPDEREYRFQRSYVEGVRLAEQGEYGMALGMFDEAVRMRPDNPEAVFNLAACHDALGDPARAIDLYRRVLDMTPNDPDCYANLGTSFIKMYYREKSPAWRKMAWEAWERALSINPQQPNIREYLAKSREVEE